METTYCCLECGKVFKTVKAAMKAADVGCPKCGGVDIDIDTTTIQPIPALAYAADLMCLG